MACVLISAAWSGAVRRLIDESLVLLFQRGVGQRFHIIGEPDACAAKRCAERFDRFGIVAFPFQDMERVVDPLGFDFEYGDPSVRGVLPAYCVDCGRRVLSGETAPQREAEQQQQASQSARLLDRMLFHRFHRFRSGPVLRFSGTAVDRGLCLQK